MNLNVGFDKMAKMLKIWFQKTNLHYYITQIRSNADILANIARNAITGFTTKLYSRDHQQGNLGLYEDKIQQKVGRALKEEKRLAGNIIRFVKSKTQNAKKKRKLKTRDSHQDNKETQILFSQQENKGYKSYSTHPPFIEISKPIRTNVTCRRIEKKSIPKYQGIVAYLKRRKLAEEIISRVREQFHNQLCSRRGNCMQQAERSSQEHKDMQNVVNASDEQEVKEQSQQAALQFKVNDECQKIEMTSEKQMQIENTNQVNNCLVKARLQSKISSQSHQSYKQCEDKNRLAQCGAFDNQKSSRFAYSNIQSLKVKQFQLNPTVQLNSFTICPVVSFSQPQHQKYLRYQSGISFH